MPTYHISARIIVHAKQVLDVNSEELALLLERSTTTVSRYATGQRLPPPKILRKLAALCGYRNVAELCSKVAPPVRLAPVSNPNIYPKSLRL